MKNNRKQQKGKDGESSPPPTAKESLYMVKAGAVRVCEHGPGAARLRDFGFLGRDGRARDSAGVWMYSAKAALRKEGGKARWYRGSCRP